MHFGKSDNTARLIIIYQSESEHDVKQKFYKNHPVFTHDSAVGKGNEMPLLALTSRRAQRSLTL